VRKVRLEGERVVLDAGAGAYQFVVRLE